jgi:hypothetical protein
VLIDVWRLWTDSQEAYQSTLTAVSGCSLRSFAQPVLNLLAPISPQHKSTLHSPPLVDAQGFPRSDIDVYAIRHARTALIRARNDREAIVDELARCLEVVFAAGGKVEKVEQRKEDAKEKRKPMARVNQVSSGSPAHTAVRLAVSSCHFSCISDTPPQSFRATVVTIPHLSGVYTVPT